MGWIGKKKKPKKTHKPTISIQLICSFIILFIFNWLEIVPANKPSLTNLIRLLPNEAVRAESEYVFSRSCCLAQQMPVCEGSFSFAEQRVQALCRAQGGSSWRGKLGAAQVPAMSPEEPAAASGWSSAVLVCTPGIPKMNSIFSRKPCLALESDQCI